MVGVLVWRRDDGRYLLLQRSSTKDHAAGRWESVSGRLEQGEGFEDAVHREALEELGLNVRVECFLGTAHFYRGDTLPEYEMVGLHFGCSIPDPTGLRLSDEHSELRWLTATDAAAFLSDDRDQWLGELIARADKFAS